MNNEMLWWVDNFRIFRNTKIKKSFLFNVWVGNSDTIFIYFFREISPSSPLFDNSSERFKWKSSKVPFLHYTQLPKWFFFVSLYSSSGLFTKKPNESMDKRGKWWWINCINAGGNKKTKELFRHSWWRVAANRLLGTDAHKANLLQNPSYYSSSKVPWYFLFVYSLLSSYAFFIHAYFKHSPHPNFAQCLKNIIKKVSFLYTKLIFL